MFVRQSTYDALRRKKMEVEADALALSLAYQQLVKQWNETVDKINARGGRAFLDNPAPIGASLNLDQVNRLIKLAHPDRHAQSQTSVEMTQVLLKMREDLRKAA